MSYCGNNVYDKKSYKIAVRKSKKQQNISNEATFSDVENENSIKTTSNFDVQQFDLINIPKAYRLFKQKKLKEYKKNGHGQCLKQYDIEKHIQRDWKNSPENPLNQGIIKNNMESTNKYSLQKISSHPKKKFRKSNKNSIKLDMDY